MDVITVIIVVGVVGEMSLVFMLCLVGGLRQHNEI